MSFSSDDEEMLQKKEIESESDVNSKDIYDENDYFNNKNIEYQKSNYKPIIHPPKLILDINKKPNDNKIFYQTKETFMNVDEKFQKIENLESLEDEFPTESAFYICYNYKVNLNDTFDYKSNKYDMYSKDHLRITLADQIKNLDWKNRESEIRQAKKETNAYEDIKEIFFDKKQSYQLANINYLFEKELIKFDSIYEGFPAFIVGDNGGMSDYILYYTIHKENYKPTIFVIPEKNNSIKNIKYRKEIQEKAPEHVKILNEFFEENKDIDENSKLSLDFINNIAKKISICTEGNLLDLFIARKVIPFNPKYSQEIRYKKFFLINTLLAFKCLAKDGNLIIKLYDTFTPFTIGLIYIIFKNFQSVSIFKPVTTRHYSSSRFLVAENYLKETIESSNNSIKYLEDYLTKYIEYSSNGLDVNYFLLPSAPRNNENFLKIIPEINNGMTEKRIDALKEIINHINNLITKLYDKMSIKKFFLDKWGVPVVNFDENLLLKNQVYRRDKFGISNLSSKKKYTQKELLDMYGGDLILDKDQEKLLEMMSGSNKNKKKNVKKITKEKEKEKNKTLEEKYAILRDKFFSGKKNFSQNKRETKIINKKRERKDSNNSKNNTIEKKNKDNLWKKKKDDEDNKGKEEKKDKKDEKDDFDPDDEELFKITPDVKQKLNKNSNN